MIKYSSLSRFAAIVLGLFMVASCGSDDANSEIEDYLRQNNFNPTITASGLYYEITSRSGSSEAVEVDDFLWMNITQRDLRNNLIGGSGSTGFPVAIPVNGLLPGLQEGLQLLNKGDMATILVPAELSGGLLLTGGVVYEVEILEIYDSLIDYNDSQITDYLSQQGLTAVRQDNGIYVIIESEGVGDKPIISSTVTVDYHGYFLNDVVFDSSVDRGTPSTFALNSVIEGWQLGIPIFGTGGKGTLFIPSYLAYGDQGNSNIPPNFPLVFEVEIVEIQ